MHAFINEEKQYKYYDRREQDFDRFKIVCALMCNLETFRMTSHLKH